MKEIKKKFKTYYDEENLSLKLDHFILFEMALMLVVYFRKDADSNKGYILFTKYTKYDMPSQNFSERDMIEIYPIQLQKGDDSDEWVNYTDSLRLGAIQYDEATIMPIPIHLASKLQEYILEL